MTHRLVGAVVAGAVLCSCGFRAESTPKALTAVEWSDEPAPATSGPASVVETVTLWFVKDDTLRARPREVPAPVDVATVTATLVAGPSWAETASRFRSAIPDAALLAGVRVSGGIAVVSLTPLFLDIPVSDQVLAIGQLVLTLTDLRGVGRVRFEVSDAAVAIPLPDGSSTDDSVSRDDFLPLAAT